MTVDTAPLSHPRLVHSVVECRAEPPIDDVIRRSWLRCLQEHRLDPARPQLPHVLERSDLDERTERFSALLAIARAEMSNLQQQVAGSSYALVLTDADGAVLHCAGDEAFAKVAARHGLRPGAVWSEEQQGTNGMGTCLVERRPIIVHREQHFYPRNIELTCSAAPILDAHGNLLAVLDASGVSRLAQQHTIVLVNMSAQVIENQFFLDSFRNHFVLRFHSRPKFINTLGEGLIAFDGDGRLLAANRSALFQLGHESPEALRSRRMDEIFHLTIAELLALASDKTQQARAIHGTTENRRFFALAQEPEEVLKRRAGRPRERADVDSAALIDQLELGDPRMADNIRRAKRIVNCRLPILLLGETGTGKGLLAKAIHLASQRAEKPFVAVNCASIPESLIESELFGYRPGAFTGASREGRRGKILQADGGTLFLDEIGDMPLALQARLLRVLEEKEVVPLGGEASVTVDIDVISATHANLKDLVSKGRFREDLYYRLQGVTLNLPALRERADKNELVRRLLKLESGSQPPPIDAEVLDLLARYNWPGNIRQLRTALKAMLALRLHERITVSDVPAEILCAVEVHDLQHPDGALGLTPLQAAERESLLRLLEQQHWNISSAAKHFALSRNTVYRKLKRYGIEPPR